ncbi:hypothetical protein V2J09_007106 [Rumex salicifolius]
MAVSKTKVEAWLDRTGPLFSLVTTFFPDLADGSCSKPCSSSRKTSIKKRGMRFCNPFLKQEEERKPSHQSIFSLPQLPLSLALTLSELVGGRCSRPTLRFWLAMQRLSRHHYRIHHNTSSIMENSQLAGIRRLAKSATGNFRSVCKKWRAALGRPILFPLQVPGMPNCENQLQDVVYWVNEVNCYHNFGVFGFLACDLTTYHFLLVQEWASGSNPTYTAYPYSITAPYATSFEWPKKLFMGSRLKNPLFGLQFCATMHHISEGLTCSNPSSDSRVWTRIRPRNAPLKTVIISSPEAEAKGGGSLERGSPYVGQGVPTEDKAHEREIGFVEAWRRSRQVGHRFLQSIFREYYGLERETLCHGGVGSGLRYGLPLVEDDPSLRAREF